MTDMPVVEIPPSRQPVSNEFEELLKQQQADAKETDSQPVKSEAAQASTATDDKSYSKWVRTRQCWCPSDAATDCRFHSPKEPGWETCPSRTAPNRTKGRWLWASIGKPAADEPEAELEEEKKEQ